MSLRHWLALAFVWLAITGCTAAQSVSKSQQNDLPSDLRDALTREYGNFDDVVTWNSLLNDLEKAEVVCIGEAHYDAHDMETAFEITRVLASKKKIALAVERFSYEMQPALDEMNGLADSRARQAAIESILGSDEYEIVWGARAFVKTGFHNNTPSTPVFENMVKWAARDGIPIIALDETLAEREGFVGDDVAWRNEIWKRQIEIFLEQHPRADYQIVVIGGINHLTNAPDSLPTKLKTDSRARVISIGQRDAKYGYNSSNKLAKLLASFQYADFVVRYPQFALVNVKGVPQFLEPPDYWITVHAPKIEN